MSVTVRALQPSDLSNTSAGRFSKSCRKKRNNLVTLLSVFSFVFTIPLQSLVVSAREFCPPRHVKYYRQLASPGKCNLCLATRICFPAPYGHGKHLISDRKEIAASDPAFFVHLTGKTVTETTHGIRRHMNSHENTSEKVICDALICRFARTIPFGCYGQKTPSCIVSPSP